MSGTGTGNGLPYLEQPEKHARAPHRAALLSYPGNLKEAFRQAVADPSKTLFGVGQGIPSVFLTKIFAAAQPDLIWLDAEHAMLDRLTLHDCVQAANFHSEGRSMAVVRVATKDVVSLTTALDAGAAGIVLPHCESAQDVAEAVKEIYYPPLGHRSFSPWTFTPGVSDASLYPDDAFNMRTSNNHVAVIAQIESVKGIENLEEIAALEGVSALMFGPGDFSADAGIPLALGGVPHPDLLAAMGKMSAMATKYNKPLFGGAQSADQIPLLLEAGYRCIATTMDVWHISQMVSSGLATARQLAKDMAKKKVVNGEDAPAKEASQ